MHCTIPLVCRFWGLSLVCVYLWKLEYWPKGDIQTSPLWGGGDIIGRGIMSKVLEPCSLDIILVKF